MISKISLLRKSTKPRLKKIRIKTKPRISTCVSNRLFFENIDFFWIASITQAKRNYRKILKIGASEGVGVAPGDEDDEDFLDGSDESDDDSSDDDDDDEETALLLEYERIKREREEKEQKEKDEKFEKMTKDEQKEIINNNPLFDENYSLKKRWYEETVFRNQTKTEPKVKKRFINDTVRSDFHKNFLKKYIWT